MPIPKTNNLIQALQDPALYDHPVEAFTLIETHISWVLLTGFFAYKIKKPVNLGFVDFSTLEKRQYYCEEELRLNRRFAPALYLEVIHISGNPQKPIINGTGKVLEYAVKMKEFRQQELISIIAIEHRLKPSHIDSIADVVSNFHLQIKESNPQATPEFVSITAKWSRENFIKIESVIPKSVLPGYFSRLKNWCLDLSEERLIVMHKRLNDGFVRECHGDLHLGNIALIDGQVTLFDCIEFNPELRWIDSMSESAFLVMDLCAHNYEAFAWRFINRYLEATGDYAGLALLSYYLVYRALVRAKVEALRINQTIKAGSNVLDKYRKSVSYLDLAIGWTENSRSAIIIMHGLSGSGKSTLARQLVEQIGAIQIRSDVERKRLYDLKPRDNSASKLDRSIYTMDATRQTYDRLSELSEIIIKAGFSVIVDASFLKISFRDQFKKLALENQAAYAVISCETPDSVLRERIKQRNLAQNDASEANLEVLQQQIESLDRLSSEELTETYTVICPQAIINTEQLKGLKQLIDY